MRAGRDAGIDFVLNARTDAFVRAAKDDDRRELVKEAVARGRACLEAGAPVVFVPGAVARDEIAALVDGLGRNKLTVISVPGASPLRASCRSSSRPRLNRAVHLARCPDRVAGPVSYTHLTLPTKRIV